jgi:hypothetical protein
MRSLALSVLAAVVFVTSAVAESPKSGVNIDALVGRAKPSDGHALMAALAGNWSVDKSMYVVAGSLEKPAKSSGMTATREWIGDGRFLRDVTQGTINGQPYFRTGILGYNNMDRRYEWVTADNVTPTMMSYLGKPGSGAKSPIVMSGSFTDLGVTGEANVGKNVPMRTVITIENNDRHVLEIYFTPPGEPERLADRAIFTRVK